MGGFFSKSVVFYENLPGDEKLTLHQIINTHLIQSYNTNPFEIIWELSNIHSQGRNLIFAMNGRDIVCRLEVVVDLIAEILHRPFTVSFIPAETVNGVTGNERCRINFIQGVPLPSVPTAAAQAT